MSSAKAQALPAAPPPGTDDAAQEPAEPIHDYPRYCLERVAPPRQYDIRAAVYKPAPWASPRA